MALFHKINPNLPYLFAIEMKTRYKVIPYAVLRTCHSIASGHLLQNDMKYNDKRQQTRKAIENIYLQCCSIHPSNKPTALSLVKLMANELVSVKNLSCSQGDIYH